jgi:cob(I)alamin adenosyltransferase
MEPEFITVNECIRKSTLALEHIAQNTQRSDTEREILEKINNNLHDIAEELAGIRENLEFVKVAR